MSSSTNTLLHPPSTAPPFQTTFAHTCDKCGADLVAHDAQRRIAELEAQVKILTGKATAAVDKLADYEDELRLLKSPSQPPPSPPSRPSSARIPLQSRFSSLLPSHPRSTSSHAPPINPPSRPPSSSSPPSPTSADLLALLTREQTLRQAAETRISQTDAELEELSAQLFAEANEMVATERKARAKLEQRVKAEEERVRSEQEKVRVEVERVRVLEGKVKMLEGREEGRGGRLEVLEGRMARIERVRGLLGGRGEG